jgi:hypothetical protein
MDSWLTWSGIKDSLSGIKDILLFLLALYGAALSTFNWRQAVRKERREIKVSMSTVIPTYHNGDTGNCFARIEATNVGHRPLTVTTIALELPTGARMFPTATHVLPGMPNSIFPVHLSDGQSAYLSLSYGEIAAALLQHGMSERIKLIPLCLDSSGGIYKGTPWDVDPHELMKM